MKWIETWAMLESISIIFGIVLSVLFLIIILIHNYKNK